MSQSKSLLFTALSAAAKTLQKYEFAITIHCSKLHSLLHAFGQVPGALLESQQGKELEASAQFVGAVTLILSNIQELSKLCVYCRKEGYIQFLTETPLRRVFERILNIRQNTYESFNTMQLYDVAKLFYLPPEELYKQHEVDLRRISEFLALLKQQPLWRRSFALDQRLKSIERNGFAAGPSFYNITIAEIPEDKVLSHDDINCIDVFNTGSSSRICRAHVKGIEQLVAVKILNSRCLSKAEMESYRRECVALSSLKHPSLLQFYGYTVESPFCIVMEYMASGSLYHNLKSNFMTPKEKTAVALDVALGMEYIHSKGIIHRDLKALNVFIGEDGHAKIGDFGLARIPSFTAMSGYVGTPAFIAPEILLSVPNYTAKVDTYSYGMLLWELLNPGKIPFEDIPVEQIPGIVTEKSVRPTLTEGTPTVLKKLICSCWASDPAERPTFTQIVQYIREAGDLFSFVIPRPKLKTQPIHMVRSSSAGGLKNDAAGRSLIGRQRSHSEKDLADGFDSFEQMIARIHYNAENYATIPEPKGNAATQYYTSPNIGSRQQTLDNC